MTGRAVRGAENMLETLEATPVVSLCWRSPAGEAQAWLYAGAPQPPGGGVAAAVGGAVYVRFPAERPGWAGYVPVTVEEYEAAISAGPVLPEGPPPDATAG